MLVARLVIVITVILAAHTWALVTPSSSAATRVSGEAFSVSAGNPSQPLIGSPYVALPPEGGARADASSGSGLGVGGVITNADQLAVSTIGGLTPDGGTVTSTATLAFIELFGGVVRVTDAIVTATSTEGGGRAFSTGSVTFGNLIVNGISYPNPRPNERVELPGLGYVVLNEQIVGGDGRTSSSIIVRALRLQVTVPSIGGVPQYTEFVVAHASTGVPEISASTIVASGPLPTATPVPFAPISTREPVDVSIGDNSDNGIGNDNDFNFNDNVDNDNVAATPTRAASPVAAPAVVTIVIVVGTSPPAAPTSTFTPVVVTPTRTPTPTATPRP